MISCIIMTLLEKNKICRTFRAVGHLGTLHTYRFLRSRKRLSMIKFISDISVSCKQNGGQNVRQSMKSPISSFFFFFFFFFSFFSFSFFFFFFLQASPKGEI